MSAWDGARAGEVAVVLETRVNWGAPVTRAEAAAELRRAAEVRHAVELRRFALMVQDDRGDVRVLWRGTATDGYDVGVPALLAPVAVAFHNGTVAFAYRVDAGQLRVRVYRRDDVDAWREVTAEGSGAAVGVAGAAVGVAGAGSDSVELDIADDGAVAVAVTTNGRSLRWRLGERGQWRRD